MKSDALSPIARDESSLRASDAPRAAPLRIALIDPALFTVPYDLFLAGALEGQGHEVLFYGRALGRDEDAAGLDRLRGLFYLELAALTAARWPAAGMRAAKGLFHAQGMRRLVHELRAMRPDVIHFQWLPLPMVDRLFLPALRRIAPLVLTVHDSRPLVPSVLMRVGATRVLTLFDRVIVHTEEARSRLAAAGLPPGNLARVPHGLLDDEAPAAAPAKSGEDPVAFLLFGKLKPYKGADLLIEAFRRLPAELRSRARLAIVGKPYMDVAPLVKRVAGFEDRIRLDFRFVPNDEMKALLASADVIIFPYREIDMSGVLMAALPYRRPFIASRIGGFAELLVDDCHGLLVPPGDVDALSAAMRRVCEEPATRLRMAHNVAALADSIPSWGEIARRTASVYRGIVDRTR